MLTGRVLSLDIGNRNMHLVQGRARGNMAELDLCIQMATPEGSVRDGAIVDAAVLRDALRDLVKTSRSTADRAIITIKSTNIINREITVPVVKPEEMQQLVRFEMEQYVPNIGNDYAMGFVISDKIAGNGAEQLRLRVSAAPRSMVNAYADLLRAANLKPTVMDTPANTLVKLVARNRKSATDWTWTNAVFIDMGYELTEINIFQGERPVFSRLIQFGSRQMDAELLGALQIEAAQLDKRKAAADLSRTDMTGADADLNEIVRAGMARWTGEIQTILQFYAGRTAELRPEIFYLYGGNAGIGGLTDFMGRVLNTPVQHIQSLPALKYVSAKKDEPADIGPFLSAGAAIFRNE